ncbi:PREDICTED: sucrose nonfermenting 4-like protein [Tarenaya hassleriana]|uniref:sucrose nonfermenting 4-like protein n=1 Tax=Tarenaya hassleriana TaxID=28532 RepID=UPI00053C31F0|nr:PREDICTED: sucrose nonfermenting 4-like protein [Tarenaya hassleriana]XP_010551059.1 PREDICTED: sucrose nonfermenting 4-like protein [Tarenaya hassleriana]
MFGPNMDSMREAGGDATSSVVIPVPFIWRHGGRNVYLTGSFTRWSELVPMSQVEGCPTVFQVICNLAPGYHQYKFFVDGEWKHDEHLPCTNSEYGIVNTVLASGPSYAMHPQMPSGSNMDVDPKAFREMVNVAEVPPIHMMTGVSEEDLRVSRHRISEYLSRHTVYELLPESGKVVALDVNLPVKQAFHILHGQGISTAPLWDFSKGNFVGVLSALDFILILRELGNHGANLTEEELETHTISAWKEGKAYLNRQADGHARPVTRNLIYVKPYDILKDLVSKILQNGVATVPVLYSSSEDGSFPQLLHLATLSGVLKCICRYFRHCSSSLPILQLPICALPVGTWVPKIGEANGRPLAMLRPNASLSQALNLLIQAQVSAVPIVDDNDSLLDIYCRSDITALAKDKVYANINLGETTIQRALQLGQDSYYPYEMRTQRCQMCLRTDSLHKVMERLANPGVRRLVVVEAGSKRVEGIISLSDIFRFFLGFA